MLPSPPTSCPGENCLLPAECWLHVGEAGLGMAPCAGEDDPGGRSGANADQSMSAGAAAAAWRSLSAFDYASDLRESLLSALQCAASKSKTMQRPGSRPDVVGRATSAVGELRS